MWWAAHVDPTPLVAVDRIGAGQSNITSLVTDSVGREWVLRCPPPGASPDAHDMRREARVISALVGTAVPVPTPVVADADTAGVSGPFFVMERAPGSALSSEEDAAALSLAERLRLSENTIAVLAELHGIDPGAVGLAELGPRDGYLERQLRRTVRNWASWSDDSAADLPWQQCRAQLERRVPRQQRTVIAHGDYRLSNLLTRGSEITAVLDWELCTLGDPLADLAWLVDDWRGADEPAQIMASPTRAGGFRTRTEITDDYAKRTGLDLTGLPYYRAFTHWKAATLLQGVLLRRRSGAMGDHAGLDLAALETSIRNLLDEALDLVAI
ncbi:hypothetical protein AD006_29325 (plasmid) [Pseudonocardia sp. EC080610-09]|nr:hypothetical protein AD006_29325 [Pseudonocardia sp. EC080610-09]ALL85808.1 hypothetical protein AD017_31930 [Pseudonocardia sp. EC080619-01]